MKLVLRISFIPNSLCIHNERTRRSYPPQAWTWGHGRCSLYRSWCRVFECIVSSKDFHSRISSISLWDLHRRCVLSSSIRTTHERWSCGGGTCRKCIWTSDGVSWRSAKAIHWFVYLHEAQSQLESNETLKRLQTFNCFLVLPSRIFCSILSRVSSMRSHPSGGRFLLLLTLGIVVKVIKVDFF